MQSSQHAVVPMEVDPETTAEAALRQWVSLHDEKEQLLASIRLARRHVVTLEEQMVEWQSEDHSRRWLSQSRATGVRFEVRQSSAMALGPAAAAAAASRITIKRRVAEKVMFDVAERACSKLVGNERSSGLASQLVDAVMQAHLRSPGLRVYRKRRQQKRSEPSTPVGPESEREVKLYEAESKRNLVGKHSGNRIDWPLLVVLRDRVGRMKKRRDEVKLRMAALDETVLAYLKQRHNRRVLLQDGFVSARQRPRWAMMTSASLARAAFQFLEKKGGAEAGSKEADAVARVARAVAAEVAAAERVDKDLVESKRKRKRSGVDGRLAKKKGKWVKIK
jgi:hypothetical protein